MTAESPSLRTLAERVSWLIQQAHPAGQEPMSDGDVARAVSKVIGRSVSPSAIWKLRTGKTVSPSWELIDGLARAFGVPAGWFSASMDDIDAESLTAQIALLAELRDLGLETYHLNTVRKVDPGIRGAIITMIEVAERALADHRADETAPDNTGEPAADPVRPPVAALPEHPDAES